MLRKIEINNFKSFEHAEFDLKNFTLLAGRNSMGKCYPGDFCYDSKREKSISW